MWNTRQKMHLFLPERKAPLAGLSAAVLTLVLVLFPPLLNADTAIVTMDVGAESSSTAQLTITPTTINFPSANPGTIPNVPAMVNPVSVTANVQTDAASTAVLTVLAAGDLISGGDRIPISKITWTATGDGYIAGTMSKDTAATAGSWQGSGQYSGTFSFFLANSWSYATGSYTQNITYTLAVP